MESEAIFKPVWFRGMRRRSGCHGADPALGCGEDDSLWQTIKAVEIYLACEHKPGSGKGRICVSSGWCVWEGQAP